MSKRYTTVIEMVRDTSSDRTFVVALERDIKEHQLIRRLTACRELQGISQGKVARHLGCSTTWVSKVEHKKDNEIKFGTLLGYAEAIGINLDLVVSKRTT